MATIIQPRDLRGREGGGGVSGGGDIGNAGGGGGGVAGFGDIGGVVSIVGS